MQEIRNNQQLVDQGEDSESAGSDSNPSEDDLPDEALVTILPKKVLTKHQKRVLVDYKK